MAIELINKRIYISKIIIIDSLAKTWETKNFRE
jgi:hypothetical protein